MADRRDDRFIFSSQAFEARPNVERSQIEMLCFRSRGREGKVVD
jgi:hypothetical protein